MSPIRYLWELDEVIQNIANQIQVLEEKRTAFTDVLQGARFDLDLCKGIPLAQHHLIEGKLATKIQATELNGLRVCGVDGGLLKKSLRGIELVITRAVATVFEYTTSGHVSAKYFPQREVLPQVKAELYPISRREAEISASLERVKAELQVAIRVQDHHPSELLLIDGSIQSLKTDRPPSQSPLFMKYEEVNALYEELYYKTEETGTLLAGVVKDSRSNRFMRLLSELLPHLIQRYSQLTPLLELDYRTVLKSIYDTEFFYRVLGVGEQSCIFHLDDKSFTGNADTGEPRGRSRNDLVGFYCQTARYDIPLRIEVFVPKNHDPKEIISKVSAMILPMSSYNQELGYPSVLIDADSQARLVERDLDFLYIQLANRLGYPHSLMKLRRERMPFH